MAGTEQRALTSEAAFACAAGEAARTGRRYAIVRIGSAFDVVPEETVQTSPAYAFARMFQRLFIAAVVAA